MSKDEPAITELRDGSIDAGLLLLSLVVPRGVVLTQEEIAFVCGCSKAYIFLLKKQARVLSRSQAAEGAEKCRSAASSGR